MESYPVKVVRHSSNKGPAAARNTGIAEATGEYLHFFDVDDLINLDFYERMIDAIVDVDADMACCEMLNEYQPGRTYQFDQKWIVTTHQDKISLTNVGIHGYAVKYLFRASFLRANHLLFEENRLIEDLPFSLQAVYSANKIVSVPNAIYMYKNRDDSIMTTKNKAQMKKRNQDWKYAKALRKAFAKKYHLTISDALIKRTQYEFFQIPVLTKRIFRSGTICWSVFGLCFLRRRTMRTK
jgi:glycosyltransferase involved in cell wall biosynthesis